MQTLQNLVDSLSRRLHCAVALDERPLNMMFHSCLYGRLDEARIRRMLAPDRGPEPEVREYVRQCVAREQPLRGPVRIPANPRLGVESRLFMPLWQGDERLGSILVFDPDYTVQEADMSAIVRAAEVARQIIRYERIVWNPERSREHDLQAALLFGDQGTRERAAIEVLRTGLLPSGPCSVLVAALPGAPGDSSFAMHLAESAEEMRSILTSGFSLLAETEGEIHIVLSAQEPLQGLYGIEEIAARLRKQAPQELCFGIGRPSADLLGVPASLQEARLALRLAGTEPFGPVVSWSGLGAFQVLLRLPQDALSQTDLVPGLEHLMEMHPGLFDTLEAFLDNGGHSGRTAEQLFIHRATLHYRLRRIEELTGRDLDSGEDRLSLHLAMKVARLKRKLNHEGALTA